MLDSKGPLSMYVKGKSESPLLLENAGDAEVMPTIDMTTPIYHVLEIMSVWKIGLSISLFVFSFWVDRVPKIRRHALDILGYGIFMVCFSREYYLRLVYMYP